MKKWWYFLLAGTLGVVAFAMLRQALTRSPIVLRVDMSSERDHGRFLPSRGDTVFLDLALADGNTHAVPLADDEEDWIYTVNLTAALAQKVGPLSADTIAFRFRHTADTASIGGGSIIRSSSSWHRVSLNVIQSQHPTFVYDDLRACTVTFKVAMHNQRVLGFFKPEEGDQVIVASPTLFEEAEGLLLADPDQDGVYMGTASMPCRQTQSFQYRYKIQTSRDVVLPYDGKEQRMRIRSNALNTVEIFDDVSHVVRFLIHTAAWEQSGQFDPAHGEALYVVIRTGTKLAHDEALFKVRPGLYEAAVMLPPQATNFEWRIVKGDRTAVSTWENAEVDVKGRTIERRW